MKTKIAVLSRRTRIIEYAFLFLIPTVFTAVIMCGAAKIGGFVP